MLVRIFGFLVLLTFTSFAAADFMDGQELHQLFTAQDLIEGERAHPTNFVDFAHGVGYVEGVTDSFDRIGFCIPAVTTNG